MRELLSGALPAPQDEPQHRDVIDDAMDWGMRRRRRDWALSGAAALAVVAVGTGVAAMSGGAGNDVSAGGGRAPSGATSTHRSMAEPSFPNGTWWTPYCAVNGTIRGDLQKYCKLYNEQQNFDVAFAKGSAPYIQAALPAGFTVRATDTYVLILTGPNGKTNYMFSSTEPASTLDGHPLGCGVPARPDCVQTSTAGGTLVVAGGPSGNPSAGYVGTGLKDPRVDILLGTSVTGAMNGMAPPTSATALLTNVQLEKILGDPGFLGYAKTQLQHLEDITKQLQSMAPPSSSYSPPSGASGSWSGTPSSPDSSESSSPSMPSGTASSSGFSWPSSPSGSRSSSSQPSSSESWPTSSGQSWPSSPSSPSGSGPSSSWSTPSSPSRSSSS